MTTQTTLVPSTFAPGAALTLTVVSDARSAPMVISGTAGPGAVIAATGTMLYPVQFQDSLGTTWTQKSDDGKTAVFTAVAGK